MLKGKVIIVTGAASGIGRATSKILAREGAKLVLADLGEAGLQSLTSEIRDAGGTGEWIKVDVSVDSDVMGMVRFTADKFGRLDGAFNNAGVMMHSKFADELKIEEWNKVINVNLSGVFYCIKHETALMRLTGGGAIVNTASICGVVGTPSAIEYVASKHGVVGLTRGAAADAANTGVRVNAVLPGSIRTPMTEEAMNLPEFAEIYEAIKARHSVGRLGEPEDVGYAVKWLLSDEAAFINGAALPVDGGYSAR